MRIGIIGFGGAGQAHFFSWSCVAGCRVTKIFDPKPGAVERADHWTWRGPYFSGFSVLARKR